MAKAALDSNPASRQPLPMARVSRITRHASRTIEEAADEGEDIFLSMAHDTDLELIEAD